MGLLNIFKLFSSKKENKNRTFLEEERINFINQSKSKLYDAIFEQAFKQMKSDFINNKGESYIYVNIHNLSISNMDKDMKHQVSLKASYEAAQKLGLKARINLSIDYPYIQIRAYYD